MMRLLFKRLSPAVLRAVASAFLASSAFGQTAFTPGNVVIYRVGTGAAALAATGTAVFLDEYTPTGALVRSLSLPTTPSGSNRRIVASGTANSEGLLQRSTDGHFLIASGYDAALVTANL
ncbi:MAG: hypothetical protein NTV80_07205, partial [Verrucomicrobia bacterium]|nr:hypothetical protein [Verrucomicrobiota bacterium]